MPRFVSVALARRRRKTAPVPAVELSESSLWSGRGRWRRSRRTVLPGSRSRTRYRGLDRPGRRGVSRIRLPGPSHSCRTHSRKPERSSRKPERSSRKPERSSRKPERSSRKPERSSRKPERSSRPHPCKYLSENVLETLDDGLDVLPSRFSAHGKADGPFRQLRIEAHLDEDTGRRRVTRVTGQPTGDGDIPFRKRLDQYRALSTRRALSRRVRNAL
jgi:hypothetical protein